MYPNTTNQKISTPMLVMAILIVIIGMAAFAINRQKSTIPSNAPTVTNDISALQPKKSSLPDFSGFDDLTNDGLADDQLTGLEYAFGQYCQTLPQKIQLVRIEAGSVVAVPRDRNSTSPDNVINFSVRLNGALYAAEVTYSSLSPVTLHLMDATTKAVVFDSGVIDINTQTPAD